MTRAPHWQHQEPCANIAAELVYWSRQSQAGRVSIAPGLLFSEDTNVIPDVVWVRSDRLASALDAAGHLIAAPDLVVEVLSEGPQQAHRDRETKRKLYSLRGVEEYWIVDWQTQRVEIYRRQQAVLHLHATLLPADELTSPLLPGFACPVARLFPYG
jgi:Uma2 family endonuclease